MQEYKNIKTQGPPFVSTFLKPKAPPWSTYSSGTTMTIIKGPSYTRRTTTRLFGNTFNHVKITLTSQTLEEKLRKVKGSTTARMTRPLIRLKSNLRWFNLPFYFTQDHQSLASTSRRSCFLRRQRFHTHNMLGKIYQRRKNMCIKEK